MSSDPKKKPSTSSSKTLLKSDVYVTLLDHEQRAAETSLGRSARSTTKKKEEKKASPIDSAPFIRFLVELGVDHNRIADPRIGKSNGCKPLSQGVAEERIRHRVLDVFGGGIAHRKIGDSNQQGKRRRRQDPSRGSLHRKRRLLDGNCSPASREERNGIWEALTKLTGLWNRQILSALSRKNAEEGDDKQIIRVAASVVSNAELIGAPTTIVCSKGHDHLVGRQGILVNETRNVFQILLLPKHSWKGSVPPHWNVRIVPKRGSRIAVRIRMKDNPENENILSVIIQDR
mmetsp:Transcript_34318/g.79216  ORF Transcript_34318/g.79216 Transcript_34318/m.79216 type:complete len:288 (-) Transcript_34318:410-1273(-)